MIFFHKLWDKFVDICMTWIFFIIIFSEHSATSFCSWIQDTENSKLIFLMHSQQIVFFLLISLSDLMIFISSPSLFILLMKSLRTWRFFFSCSCVDMKYENIMSENWSMMNMTCTNSSYAVSRSVQSMWIFWHETVRIWSDDLYKIHCFILIWA